MILILNLSVKYNGLIILIQLINLNVKKVFIQMRKSLEDENVILKECEKIGVIH